MSWTAELLPIVTTRGTLDLLTYEWYAEASNYSIKTTYSELSQFIDVDKYMFSTTYDQISNLTNGYVFNLDWYNLQNYDGSQSSYITYATLMEDIYRNCARLYPRKDSRFPGYPELFYSQGKEHIVVDVTNPYNIDEKISCHEALSYCFFNVSSEKGNKMGGKGTTLNKLFVYISVATNQIVAMTTISLIDGSYPLSYRPYMPPYYYAGGANLILFEPFSWSQNSYPPMTATPQKMSTVGDFLSGNYVTLTNISLMVKRSSGSYWVLSSNGSSQPHNLQTVYIKDTNDVVDIRAQATTYRASIELNESIVDLKGEDLDMYNPRIGTKGVGFYKLTKAETQFLFKTLWETDWTEALGKFFGDVSDGIISLKWYYGAKQYIQTDGKKYAIVIGNVVSKAQGGGMATGEKCLNEFVTIETLPVAIPRLHNNYLDFSPHTDVDLHIPYYGYHKLNASQVMGKTLRVVYNFSIMTGIGVATIYVGSGSSEIIYDTLPTNMAVDIPVDAKGAQSLLASILTVGLTAAPAIAMGVVTGGASIALAGAGASLLGGAGTQPTITHKAGGLAPESSILMPMKLALTITSPVVVSENASSFVGKPTMKIKNMSGYSNGTYVKGVINSKSVNADNRYNDEIQRLLRSGVFI